MKAIIKGYGFNNFPSAKKNSVHAPASKSSMQRACAAALVRKGESIIRNPGKSNDDIAGLNVIQTLGAEVENLEDGSLKIISDGIDPVSSVVNNGEAGLGIRMFTPIVALSKKEMLINGEGSLLTRPMDFFDEVMPQLGVQIASNEGKLPIKIQGPLQPKDITIDGSLSSQFLTGLLLAYAAKDAKNVTINVTNLKSKPYVDLTLSVMESFLLKVPENRNYEAFYFDETPDTESGDFVDYTVEGDWSGGAFLLVFGAIAGNIKVAGLDIASTQADKKILEALESCGAQLLIGEKEIEVASSGDGLKAFEFDATDCPDLFPPLAALAACCKGITKITGVHRLAHKESNRALTIQEELGKMNIKVVLNDNVMEIEGTTKIKAVTVHSHHDHRIAMMCALLALKADGETTIEVAEAINKSYPDFYRHLQELNASVNFK
ncbi:3-phosphoshikimate 1-carboxyvinyltransferase [Parafilimonas terrae]|uniref:3-phosphoshikimate 1-carboxyvinyltransferase n=1 Tax=Parafilimonas terrae TaxID=1465490 RepID=A0A1I5XB57_9BACT|nr:3-phosphoshikimate 1-carboxyvinyltransferase [Parafilimonas terrae]SFQ29190.1 3-phosphoshikimate 1-carboxyvinyltransferase [Parafilimonas terrae]